MAHHWHGKRWREFRAEHIKDKCEVCGASGPEANLTLHHTTKLPPFTTELYHAVQSLYIERTSEPVWEWEEKPYKTILRCPECEKVVGRPRKTKTPAYRCVRCRFEFDTPAKDPQYRWRFTEDYLEFAEREREGVASALTKARDEWYHDPKNVMTVCKGCHLLLERGLVRCKKCGERWHKARYPCCFECLPEERKAAIQREKEEWTAMEEQDHIMDAVISMLHETHSDPDCATCPFKDLPDKARYCGICRQ